MERSRIGWRRALVAALTALSIGLLAACGSDSSSGGAKPTAQSAKGAVNGTLSFWLAPTQSSVGKWWNTFIKGFEARHPGAKIDVTQYSTEEFPSKTLAAFASGDEPDVFETDTGEYLNKYIRTGKIAQLNNLAKVGDYNPASLGPVTLPGNKLYAIPDYWYVLSMWDNPALMAKAGVAEPKSWSDLLASCRKLSGQGDVPIAFGDGGQDQWTAGHWFSTLLYQYGGPTAAVDAAYGTGGASWSDPPFIKAATALKALVDAKCFPNGFTGINYSQMSSLFLRGKAPMIYTGAWFGGQIEAGAKGLKPNVFAPADAPGAVNSTQSLHGIVGGVSAIAASSRAAQRNPALVAAFLNDFGAAADQYANQNAQLSVAATPHPRGGSVQAQLTSLLTGVKHLAPVTDTNIPASLVNDYYQNLQALTAGALTPQQFGQKMVEAVAKEKPNFPKQGTSGE
ncbi:MAG TPA: extracellular solute-binding protein [Conexibacter sp.]|jgi:raffinose/stachyose/melibiose transport system substrate-binding protein|nr:extracellular solute-binding protein [Conexibacter sp.]